MTTIKLTGKYPSEYTPKEVTKIAEKHLGHCSKMLSGSKSGYSQAFPAHIPIFNANVCTAEHGKIWYGDLDLTLQEELLLILSRELNAKLFVLYEMDGRFENEDSPKTDRAVLTVMKYSSLVGERISEYVQRCTNGKNKGRLVYKKEYRR